MPSFLIPDGGVDIFYVDESAGSGVFAMASLRIPMIRAEKSGQAKMVWPEYYEKATSWRRSLSKVHNIRFVIAHPDGRVIGTGNGLPFKVR
jgi:hypothetical protein